jgi:hypothetical protein
MKKVHSALRYRITTGLILKQISEVVGQWKVVTVKLRSWSLNRVQLPDHSQWAQTFYIRVEPVLFFRAQLPDRSQRAQTFYIRVEPVLFFRAQLPDRSQTFYIRVEPVLFFSGLSFS